MGGLLPLNFTCFRMTLQANALRAILGSWPGPMVPLFALLKFSSGAGARPKLMQNGCKSLNAKHLANFGKL